MFPAIRIAASAGCAGLLLLSTAGAQVTLQQLSHDPFHGKAAQHATEVEPHILAHGSTLVAAFQVGRVYGGGCNDIGYATSTDGGQTWTHGYLPGLTISSNPKGPFQFISDPAVAYDAKHGVWLISSLPVSNGKTPAVMVSSSSDGLNWQSPVKITSKGDSDKDWISCDSNSSSPFYGNCYVEWDEPAAGNQIRLSTSTDGGQTWSEAVGTTKKAAGVGGVAQVRPDGTVVVPMANPLESSIRAFTSTDGGTSWGAPVTVSSVKNHFDPGKIRSGPLPSSTIDGAGNIYVVWEDCRFRTGCKSNDLVMSTTADGTTWTAPVRIPIDATTSTVDHFIPGIAADPLTSGSGAHLALTYYYYPDASCKVNTCDLAVGFIESLDGGATWSAAQQLAGPMKIYQLPATLNGRMVGDYIATAFSGGKAFGVFAVAKPKSANGLREAIYTVQGGLSAPVGGPTFSSAGEIPVTNAASDHPPLTAPVVLEKKPDGR